jgi:hypothetical protein
MANPTYTLIGTPQVVGSGGASAITFSSIPATYTDLLIKCSVRTDRTSSANDYLKITINSGSSYSGIQFAGNGSSATSGTFSSIGATQYAGDVNGPTSTSSTFAPVDIYIPNYASSNAKSYSVESAFETNSTGGIVTLDAGLWSGTSAITQIAFAPGVGTNFVQYSSFYLYGIKNS